MKLLVGGDSFGTADMNKDVLELYKIKYYWHRQLAAEYGAEYKNVAVGGADIYYSTFRAIQAILNDPEITHMMFFITDLSRDLLNRKDAMDVMMHNVTNLDIVDHDFYRTHNPNTTCESTGTKWEVLQKPGLPLFRYFINQSTTKLFHAGLAVLTQLATLCHKRNIKMMFVHTCFKDQINYIESNATEFMLNFQSYKYVDALGIKYYNEEGDIINWRSRWPAHMSPDEHPILLSKFKSLNPTWMN